MKSALILACLLAASPLASGYAEESPQASLEGQVVNRASGAPVRGATVTLSYQSRPVRGGQGQAASQQSQQVVESDAQGRFAFSNLPPGGYRVSAQRSGYVNQFNVGFSQQQLYYVGERQQLKDVLVKLLPQAVISGKVLDEYGEPLQGAQVSLMRRMYFQGKARWSGMQTAQTSDLGEYRLAGIAGGQYLVSASFRGPYLGMTADRPLPDKPELTYITTYYPDAVDVTAAKPVSAVEGGEVRNIDIRLAKRPTVRVRGRVVDPSDSSNQMPSVQLVPKDASRAGGFSANLWASISSMDGTFEIPGAPPGSYYLVAQKSVGGMVTSSTPAWSASQSLEVGDKPIDGIVLRLTLGHEVKGKIRVEGDAPLDLRNLSITLNPASGMFGSQNMLRGLEGPEFTFKNVLPGLTSVTVQTFATGSYVKSIQYGGKEIPADGADLTTGESLSILLSPSGAAIAGKVVDARQAPVRAVVTLVPSDGQPSNIETMATGRLGEFRYTPILRPGDYKLYAWETADSNLAQDPEIRKRFEAKATPVKLIAGGHETVTLTAISAAELSAAVGTPSATPETRHPKGSIEGEVLREGSGAPVRSATVRLASSCNSAYSGGTVIGGPNLGSTPPQSTETDERGHFTFREVEPGMYPLCAEHSGYGSVSYGQPRDVSSELLVVGDGQRVAGIVLKLPEQTVLAGKVVDENGDPMAGVYVAPARAEYRNGRLSYAALAGARTDDLGEFRVSGARAGSYVIQIRPDPPLSQAAARDEPLPDKPDTGYAPVYYPAAADATAAKPVVLRNGVETDLKIVLRKTALLRVRGTVTGWPEPATAPGRPAPPLLVTLYRDTPGKAASPSLSTSARADGSFAFTGVPPGSYRMVARLSVVNMRALAATATVEVKDQHVDGLKLALVPGREVTVRVTGEAGLHLDGLAVNLAPANSLGGSSYAYLQNGGTKLVFHDVLPMPYRLSLGSLPNGCHCYVKSIAYDGREIPEDGADVTGGAPLEIAIGAGAATLAGAVVDAQAKPSAEAAVAVLPKDGPLSALKTAIADGAGKFVLDNLAPGEYLVWAWEDADTAAFHEPGYLKRYEAKAKPVTLPSGERTSVRVTALPAK